VAILVAHLEDSLLAEQGQVDLAAAIADHRASVARRGRVRAGDRDRSRELRDRSGWSWVRPFRRLDDYTRALDRLQAESELLEAERRVAERPGGSGAEACPAEALPR
jgi:hypothetical protein